MVEAMLFLMGFASVVGVYEIATTGKKTKSDKILKSAERIGKKK